jgi:hypothetical protein
MEGEQCRMFMKYASMLLISGTKFLSDVEGIVNW